MLTVGIPPERSLLYVIKQGLNTFGTIVLWW